MSFDVSVQEGSGVPLKIGRALKSCSGHILQEVSRETFVGLVLPHEIVRYIYHTPYTDIPVINQYLIIDIS